MKIIITSGGTSEAIDGVRKITNMSTGVLGSKIADNLVDTIKDVEIFFISDIKLALPLKNEKIKVIPVTDTNSVLVAMKSIIETNAIEYVIHSMAISDYTVASVFNADNIKDLLSKHIDSNVEELTNKIVNEITGIDNSKKISSNQDNLFIKLVKTPKIVDMIKQLDSNIKLISFKLLNGVPEEELIEVGQKQLERTNSSLVIANDLVNIKKGNHRAIFIKENGYKIVEGKDDIANQITEFVISNAVKISNKDYVNNVLFKHKFIIMRNNNTKKLNKNPEKVFFGNLFCDECGGQIYTYDADVYHCSDCSKKEQNYELAILK